METESTVWDLETETAPTEAPPPTTEKVAAKTAKKASKKVSKKAKEARVSRAYARGCEGVQVSIMDLGKIFALGMSTIEEGVDDAELEKRIAAYVETIRKN